MTPCPVSVRGRIYPSQKVAAAALGVKPSAISQALMKRGHLDRVGIGAHGGQPGNTNSPAKPVQIGPHRFRSQKAASEALGVPRRTIARFASGQIGKRGREIVIAAAMAYGRDA